MFSFPSPDALARTTERELRKCGLGYRAKNLLATAKRVASGEADLEFLESALRAPIAGAYCASFPA